MLKRLDTEGCFHRKTARTRLGHWTMIDRSMATLGSRSLSEVAQRLTMMFGPDALALAAACGGAADQPIDPGRHNHRSRTAPRCGGWFRKNDQAVLLGPSRTMLHRPSWSWRMMSVDRATAPSPLFVSSRLVRVEPLGELHRPRGRAIFWQAERLPGRTRCAARTTGQQPRKAIGRSAASARASDFVFSELWPAL